MVSKLRIIWKQTVAEQGQAVDSVAALGVRVGALRRARFEAEQRVIQERQRLQLLSERHFPELPLRFPWAQLRVRFHIIRNARIENVGKFQSCMVSKLRIIWKQTVAGRHI